MSKGRELVQIHPLELRFPFELHKEIICPFQIINKTDEYVAFKIQQASREKYGVSPSSGVIQPCSSFSVVVTMSATTEAPLGMQCSDKFKVQSVIAAQSTTVKSIKDVTNIMKVPGKVLGCDITLSVAYVQNQSKETVKRPKQQVNFQIPEKIDEEEEDEEHKAIPASTQNALAQSHGDDKKLEAALREEIERREKIEEELSRVREELEKSKKLVEELRLCCIQFKFEELEEATNNFDQSLMLGEGGFGTVYKGFLRHTHVAIKMLKDDCYQNTRGFHEEIETLSKVRHPNLVTLVGACNENPQKLALVYEFISGGSLQDHLERKNNTPALPWQTRIRIASHICSALIYLHSTPRAHGDLKPDNILIDSNYVSKISDFGTCRQLKITGTTDVLRYTTANPGACTRAYMDPMYFQNWALTAKSDVYSFGLVLLQLVTGKDVFLNRLSVDKAIREEKFGEIVDASANWPRNNEGEFAEARKLADLGLQCSHVVEDYRSDLANDAWSVLESLVRAASVIHVN